MDEITRDSVGKGREKVPQRPWRSQRKQLNAHRFNHHDIKKRREEDQKPLAAVFLFSYSWEDDFCRGRAQSRVPRDALHWEMPNI
jgi:hypothetical protein